MNILLAVDGSQHSVQAARLLRRIAGGEHFVTVFCATPAASGAGREGPSAAEAPRESGGRIAAAVAATLARPGPGSLTAAPKVAESRDAAGSILREAERGESDLIVLGARGLTPLKSFFLGSVSQKVSRRARTSVLIARRPPADRRGPLKVLVALDGSLFSRRALAFLPELRMPPETLLTLMHAVNDPSSAWGGNPLSALGFGGTAVVLKTREESLAALRRKGRRILRDARQALAPAYRHVETVLAEGYPPSEILKAARNRAADLVVVGRRGLSGPDGFFPGSVSHKVALYTASSVLIVK